MKTACSILSLAAALVAGPLAASAKSITVAADGSGDFKTVQQAIAAAPATSAEPVVIHIKAGQYEGPFTIPKDKPHLTLAGDGAATTKLLWNRNVNDPKPPGADGFNPGMLVRADDFQATGLTIENTSGDHGQALALRIDGDRAVLTDCHILGWQDTLMVNNGRDYFRNCTIAGRVDFIYGSATAVFDHCEIHSRNGGHITAASTPQEQPFGFVFLNCKLTGDAIAWDPATTNPATTQKAKVTPQADLGRPWRPYGAVAYVNCEMGAHIKPEGWNNWGKAENEKTARYAEYHSTGAGATPGKRFAWARQLTDKEAAALTPAKILAGRDGWNPEAAAATRPQ